MTNSSRKSATSRAEGPKSWFKGRAMTAAMVAACLAIAGGVVWTYGLSGLGDNWFYLILLACPLMHFFMHRRNGHGEQQRHRTHHAAGEDAEPNGDR